MNWVNITGVWMDSDVWFVRLVELCETDAWEHETARMFAERYLAEDAAPVESRGLTPWAALRHASQAVWLNAIAARRERFPVEAIEIGPAGLND